MSLPSRVTKSSTRSSGGSSTRCSTASATGILMALLQFRLLTRKEAGRIRRMIKEAEGRR